MGLLIQPGTDLVAGQGPGQLNQYYGYADVNPTTITGTSYVNLSTSYSIPAGEAYAGSSYRLACAGYGTWGSTGQALDFSAYIGSLVTGCQPAISSVAVATSAAFAWSMVIELTCSDGVSAWEASMLGDLVETANALSPGTAASNAFALAGATSSAHTASVSSAIPVALQARWGSATGGPTITCVRTNFRKVA